ncbi:MAG: hypothetical protein LBH28_02975 [Oscillospiraceae bacterium]|jgi:hypothetical protein|nr:hypothetical protein [Oscillospiraceae bacterium]
MSKTKSEALRIVHSGAVAYQNNLVNKNVLFVALNHGKAEPFETSFLPRNFLHLTGIRTELNSTTFYRLALRDRVGEHNIAFAEDGTTDKKLDVLQSLMNIQMTARMLGDYDNSQRLLVTDKLAGTVTSAMGFRRDGDVYMPNTSLKTDMRTITLKPVRRIAAIFVKGFNEEKYCNLTYIAKGLTIDDDVFIPVIREKVDKENLKSMLPVPKPSLMGRLAEAQKEADENNSSLRSPRKDRNEPKR